MTTRRNFILNATLGLSALAVAPSVFASSAPAKKALLPLAPTRDPLFPRQALMREKARTAREMYLCWGQRSGKSHLAGVLYQDRLRSLHNTPPKETRQIFVVSAVSSHLRSHYSYLFDSALESPANIQTHFVRPEDAVACLRGQPAIDSIFLDEADWYDSPELILRTALLTKPDFLLVYSSPRSHRSPFLQETRFRMAFPVAGAVHDHATTFEVNPLYTRASLVAEERRNPEAFARDFLAYK